MVKPVDDATQQFLDAAAANLQRQLRLAGTVEDLALEDSRAETVTLLARIRVGSETLELRCSGENLISAYAALTRVGPEPMLVSAYRQLLDA
jgi:hypothetical protein